MTYLKRLNKNIKKGEEEEHGVLRWRDIYPLERYTLTVLVLSTLCTPVGSVSVIIITGNDNNTMRTHKRFKGTLFSRTIHNRHSNSTKHIKRSKGLCLVGQNTTCEF